MSLTMASPLRSIYQESEIKVHANPFDGNEIGKTSRELNESEKIGRKKGPLSKIPEFWAAKYRCILMGVILFFSIAEILMFNINNFLQGESTKSVLQKFMKRYMTNQTESLVIQ